MRKTLSATLKATRDGEALATITHDPEQRSVTFEFCDVTMRFKTVKVHRTGDTDLIGKVPRILTIWSPPNRPGPAPVDWASSPSGR